MLLEEHEGVVEDLRVDDDSRSTDHWDDDDR